MVFPSHDRGEWDVDKAILQPLSMTFFLQTKLAALQDDIVMGKFRCLDKTTPELIWDEVSKFFGNVFPTIKERLVSKKILDVSENAAYRDWETIGRAHV